MQQSPREADDNLGTAGREGDGDRLKERARDEEGGEGEGGGEILNGGVEEEEEREEDGAGSYLGGDEAGREEAGRVLEGVVLCVNKKIQAPGQYGLSESSHLVVHLHACVCVCVLCVADLHNLAGSLGADCHWTFRDSCTHYVYQVN